MKKLSVLALFFSFGVSLLLAQNKRIDTSQDFPANPIRKKGWVLTAHDEFTATSLDTNLWIPYYLRHRVMRDQDVSAKYIIKDGCLILQNTNADGASSIQTAERSNLHKRGVRNIPTKVNFMQKYGYFEIRAKTAGLMGHNSAFWLIGMQQDSTQNAEIDVFEQTGKYGNKAFLSSLHRWKDSTIAPNLTNKNSDYQYKFVNKRDLTNTFNIYAIEWTPTEIKYYFNNALFYTVPCSPNYSMGVLLSLYKGTSDFFGMSSINAQKEKNFVIDYFRAYQRP